MALSNCIRCGTVFSRVSKLVCPACIQKEETDFLKAVECLRDNPRQSIQKLSDNTGIDRSDILKWIREKRLVLTKTPEVMIGCKKCGVPIEFGTFCDKCKLGLSQEVSENLKEIEEQKRRAEKLRHGMHYSPADREGRSHPR